MDNEQLLMQLGKFDFLARTPGLGSRVPVERDDLRRLLADSEAYAKLRAEIAAKAAEWRGDAAKMSEDQDVFACLPAAYCECADELDALLRLPEGDSQDTTTRAQGEGSE